MSKEICTKEEIIEFLGSVLYYKGRGANNGVWESWKSKKEIGDNFINLPKPHSWKTLGHIRLWYYTNEYPDDYIGHEIKVDIYLNSYCEFFPMFEGWVDNIEELKTIFKCIGVPFNIKDNE